MAPAAKPEKVTDLERRVSVLEDRSKGPSPLVVVLVSVIATALIGGIGWWGFFVTTNVIAMKQQLADGGAKQLVANIKAPKSPQQLQASLSTVVAQIETARAEGKTPSPNKIANLSEAVAGVLHDQPSLAEGWQAAGELVSFRFRNSAVVNLGKCVDRPFDATPTDEIASLPKDSQYVFEPFYHDCTLVLDDVSAFEKSALYQHRLELQKMLAGTDVRLAPMFELGLVNVHVIYHGGQIIPVTSLVFVDCTFVFDFSEQPPPTGRSITQTLLAAVDGKKIKVNFPPTS